MLGPSRPLSPYLHYRWQYTNTLSILHRASGIILSGGFLLLAYWITAIARGVVCRVFVVDSHRSITRWCGSG